MRSGHNRAVDWWSLGALMYDMLTGAVSSHVQSVGRREGAGFFSGCCFILPFIPPFFKCDIKLLCLL